MMRLLTVILLTLVPSIALAADGQRGDEPASSIPYEDEEQLIENLIQNPPLLSQGRPLPPGFRIGRCLLVVEGKTRISGKCAYRIDKGGDFLIEGPHQIYDGIDYPGAHGSIALLVSTDYWATVFREEDGTWNGYGNDDIRGVKGEGPNFGPLLRKGACFLNERVRVCLWKK